MTPAEAEGGAAILERWKHAFPIEVSDAFTTVIDERDAALAQVAEQEQALDGYAKALVSMTRKKQSAEAQLEAARQALREIADSERSAVDRAIARAALAGVGGAAPAEPVERTQE